MFYIPPLSLKGIDFTTGVCFFFPGNLILSKWRDIGPLVLAHIQIEAMAIVLLGVEVLSASELESSLLAMLVWLALALRLLAAAWTQQLSQETLDSHLEAMPQL